MTSPSYFFSATLLAGSSRASGVSVLMKSIDMERSLFFVLVIFTAFHDIVYYIVLLFLMKGAVQGLGSFHHAHLTIVGDIYFELICIIACYNSFGEHVKLTI
jgi:hypothetical protein